jgi:uncharacterized membrane protein
MTEKSTSPSAPFSWTYLIAALISLIGLGDGIYLTVQHITGASLRCTIISGCSEVLSSPYAQVGPVPLAAVGAAAYFVVFSLAILAAFAYPLVKLLLKIVLGLMFLTTLWLLYLQAFVIHHFCQYCLLSAGVTTALTLIVFVSGMKKKTV